MAMNILEYQELLRNLPDGSVVGRAKKGDDRSWMAGDELKRREEMRSAEAAEMAEKKGSEPNVMEQYIARAQGAGQTPQMGPMDALAGMGRGGDTDLMHVGPEQVNQMGTSINPQTGLPEAFAFAPALPWILPLLAALGPKALQYAGKKGVPFLKNLAAGTTKGAPKAPVRTGGKWVDWRGPDVATPPAWGKAAKGVDWMAKHPKTMGAGGLGAGLIMAELMKDETFQSKTDEEKQEILEAAQAAQAAQGAGGAGGDEGSGTGDFNSRMEDFRKRYAALDRDIDDTAPGGLDQIWEQLGAFGKGMMTPGDFGVGWTTGMSAATEVPAQIRAEQRDTQGERVDLVNAEANMEIAIHGLMLRVDAAIKAQGGAGIEDLDPADFMKMALELGIVPPNDPQAHLLVAKKYEKWNTALKLGQLGLAGRMAEQDNYGLWSSGSSDDT